MKVVFADTWYWIAITKPNDSGHVIARTARLGLGPCVLVTTDGVLTEFLAALSKGGPALRETAVKLVEAILADNNVLVVPQTRDSFLKALTLYKARPDKQYSLVDCNGMNVMEERGIRDVLTSDHHFEQEGFTRLIKEGKA